MSSSSSLKKLKSETSLSVKTLKPTLTKVTKFDIESIEKSMLEAVEKELREEFKNTTIEEMDNIASHRLALDMKKIKRRPIINERLKEYFKLSNPSSIDECKALLCKYAIILDHVQKNRLLEKFPTPTRGILLIYLHLRDKLEELQGHKLVIP
jgi:hypothetical protein